MRMIVAEGGPASDFCGSLQGSEEFRAGPPSDGHSGMIE